jgi:hypothetical protein
MDLPNLHPTECLALRRGEVFVCASGFEERVLAFPGIIEPTAAPKSKAIILGYLPHEKENRLAQINDLLCARGCDTTCLPYNRHDPGSFDAAFRTNLTDLDAEAVCLDVSGMSRLAILIIMDVVREMNLPLRVAYAEAREYAPSQGDFEKAKAAGSQHIPTSFIHTGVYDVLHVARLSSIRMQNHATLLIAFDSFNEALCQALVNVINPARFVLINGRPPRNELGWREDATAHVHQRLRREWSIEKDNDPAKVTSTLWYQETYQLLVDLYWKFSDRHRIILAPTGSKMQTIGCYLLRAVHDDVHMEYPTVQGFFADKYSTGVRETWIVDFGRLADFAAKLRSEELKEHLGLPEETVDTEIA